MANILGKNIKRLREKYELSQEQLADKLSVSSQAISKWENGDSYPSIETLISLSKIFFTSIDSMVTNMQNYEELDSNIKNINFRLKQMYYRYNKGESISGELNDIIALILPVYNNSGDYFWIYSARVLLKGVFYAMFEDKNIDDEHFNLQKVKDILQSTNTDDTDRKNKIKAYFDTKSDKCKEMANVYLMNATVTGNSFLSMIIVNINMLS